MKPTAPTPELSPEVRAWLATQVRILAYWDSCPDAYFTPPLPPAKRAADKRVLVGLQKLLK